MQELFEAIREECSRDVWSRGVELARSGNVVPKEEDGGTAVFRVKTPGHAVSRTVTLEVDDLDWSCDCPAQDGVCVHVAAAVIALRRMREAGESLPSAPRRVPAQVGYRFQRAPGGLAFDRVLVLASGELSLQTSVASASQSEDGPSVIATAGDLQVERFLGTRKRGVFSREFLAPLLGMLADVSDVRLDGKPVKIAAEGSLVHARVIDQGTGFRLYIEQDPTITEIFDNGAVLCGDVLKPVGAVPLSPRELQVLRDGRFFGREQVVELVTDVLPSIAARVPLEIRTQRLPKTVQEKPRIHLDLQQFGEVLEVLPTLVYGDPPIARIDAGKLVHLQGPIALRNEAAEERLSRDLTRDFGLGIGRRERLRGTEAIALMERLRTWKGGVQGVRPENFLVASGLQPQVKIDGGGLDLSFGVSGAEGRSVDAAAVMRAWEQGEAFVPLLEGGFAPLPVDWLERFGTRVAELLSAKNDQGELAKAAMPALAQLCEELEYPAPPELGRLRPLLHDFTELPAPRLPEDLRADLRSYQRQGVAWLSFLREAGLGALLADDMGLGKTLQTICVLRQGTLVVAPTSVLYNWKSELERFRPNLRVAVYHGSDRALDPQADVTLTTYAILRLDTEQLASRQWDTVVLDEAQAIKNPDSQVARAAYALDAGFRVCLSGTPVENRLDELWSLFHFANRGLLGGRKDFEERFEKPIGDGVPGAAQRLRSRIKPFVLRRLKRDVASELPPRTDVILRCTLSDDERRVYEAVHAASVAEVVERLQAGGNALQALEVLLRLRQASCHAGLVPGQHATRSSKVDLLLEQLEEAAADGHKSLVFSQWTRLLDLVEPHLKKAGLDFVRLDGSTEDRAGVVAKFQANDGPPVMLLSLKAGGTGLNLTAADHVFLLDPWWNPAVEDQAADRAHRIGQQRPVEVHRLVAENTVEERILALQQRKRALADAALAEGDMAAALTREDLLELLA